MAPFKEHLGRRLTPLQAVAVVVVAALLAGLVYWAFNLIAAWRFEARIRAALPQVCASIRTQREELVKAIEAYKAHFGAYPPDHVASRQPLVVDAVTNTLLYELAGVVYDPARKCFCVDQMEQADADYVRAFFHVDRFRNCAESRDQVKRFLPPGLLPAKQLHDDPDVFVLSAVVPYGELDRDLMWTIQAGPWHYVCTAPTNNPGHFDVWLDVRGGGRRITIGNWKAVE